MYLILYLYFYLFSFFLWLDLHLHPLTLFCIANASVWLFSSFKTATPACYVISRCCSLNGILCVPCMHRTEQIGGRSFLARGNKGSYAIEISLKLSSLLLVLSLSTAVCKLQLNHTYTKCITDLNKGCW